MGASFDKKEAHADRPFLRSDLIELLSEYGGFSREESSALVVAFLDSMTEALARGENIEIRGFGTFVVREYDGYSGRDPRTNERIFIDARRSVLFRPSKVLRERINSSDS